MKKWVLTVSIGVITASMIYNLQFDNKQQNALNDVRVFSSISEPNKSNSDYEIVDSHISLSKIFHNINQLDKRSDIIIEGVVKNTKYETYVHSIFTVSEIEINEVYKNDGNAVKGSTICVVEPGGIMDKEFLYNKYKEKFPDEYIDINQIKPAKNITDGVPALEKGDHVILFASKYTGGVKSENCYEPVGLYQGKFYIDGNKVEHKMPNYLKDKFEDKVKTKEELINLIKKN